MKVILRFLRSISRRSSRVVLFAKNSKPGTCKSTFTVSRRVVRTAEVRESPYSGVPNKRGGVRIIGGGGLEMVQYNSYRGGGGLEK